MYKKIKHLSLVFLLFAFGTAKAGDGALRSLGELYSYGWQIQSAFPELLKLRGVHMIYGFHGFNCLEGGIGFGSRDILKPHVYSNTSLTLLYGYKDDQNIGGLNVGYKRAGLLGLYAIHLSYYNDFNKSQSMMLRPELGLTFLGLVDLTYGINFPIMQNQLNYNQHLISVRVTRQRIVRNAQKHTKKIRRIIAS